MKDATPLTDAEISNLANQPRAYALKNAKVLATITSLQGELQRTRDALKECSDDLAQRIEVAYAMTMDTYPSEKRHYDEDMEPVLKARALITPPTGAKP